MGMLGDVGQPQPVRAVGGELSLDQVSGVDQVRPLDIGLHLGDRAGVDGFLTRHPRA